MTTSHIFQSTLPHGERRASTSDNKSGVSISIHAPAWGATIDQVHFLALQFISIHAPAWGATVRSSRKVLCALNFNPRSRMGSDNNDIQHSVPDSHFNPRSRMGSDHPHDVFQYVSSIFQSTPPHGERPILSLGVINSNDFNPRPRMGSDNSAGGFKLYRLYFNPRPRMGSDTIPNHHPALISLFQSTPPHGERRHRQLSKEYHLDNFNPRPRMGSDGSFS